MTQSGYLMLSPKLVLTDRKMRMKRSELQTLLPKLGVELAVIIVGVLIALWTNEWWAERGDRAAEVEILSSMLEDVRASQTLLHEYVNEQEEVLSDLRTVLGDSGEYFEDANGPELAKTLYSALWNSPPLDLQMSVYEEIKGAGRLALIRSAELRRSLAEYDASVSMLRRTRDDLMQHQQTKVDVYAIENFQMSQFANFLLDENDEVVLSSRNTIDHRALIGEMKFQNLVLTKYAILQIGHRRITGLQTLLNRIENLLTRSLSPETAV